MSSKSRAFQVAPPDSHELHEPKLNAFDVPIEPRSGGYTEACRIPTGTRPPTQSGRQVAEAVELEVVEALACVDCLSHSGPATFSSGGRSG